jgi:hypothetical protein
MRMANFPIRVAFLQVENVSINIKVSGRANMVYQ